MLLTSYMLTLLIMVRPDVEHAVGAVMIVLAFSSPPLESCQLLPTAVGLVTKWS